MSNAINVPWDWQRDSRFGGLAIGLKGTAYWQNSLLRPARKGKYGRQYIAAELGMAG